MGDYYQSNGGGGYTGEDDAKGKNLQTIVPATIKQLSTAEHGAEANTFSIDGKRLHRVKVVAQIMGINRQATAVTLELDDGTGRIDTRYWLTNDADEEGAEENDETSDWQEGVYVRVFGHLRQFKNSEKNSFVAMSIKPVQDFNEITFHLLEAIYVHLKNLKEAQNPMANQSMMAGQSANQANPYAADQSTQSDDLQPLYATVLDVIQRASVNSTEGASIAFIAEQMSPYGVDEASVRGAIEYLSSEGHVYPTFDEEHFKA